MAEVIADSGARDIEPATKGVCFDFAKILGRRIGREIIRRQLRPIQGKLGAIFDEVGQLELGRFAFQQVAIAVRRQAEFEMRAGRSCDRLDCMCGRRVES